MQVEDCMPDQQLIRGLQDCEPSKQAFLRLKT